MVEVGGWAALECRQDETTSRAPITLEVLRDEVAIRAGYSVRRRSRLISQAATS
jgi:hypothetical protein